MTALAGSAVPLAGRATGRVDLTFPGTDFKLASGTVTTQLSAEAGETSADRIPITGEVAMRADRGTFDIQQVNLQTPATRLTATGRFSFENDSDLQVDLNSTDAAELQTVLISSGLLPEVEEQMDELWNRNSRSARFQRKHPRQPEFTKCEWKVFAWHIERKRKRAGFAVCFDSDERRLRFEFRMAGWRSVMEAVFSSL